MSKLRATTAEWRSGFPWHFGGGIPSLGPVVGIDLLAGGAPFGIDPFAWVNEGVAQNPNMVVAGAPANGKSSLVKAMLWWLTGTFGYRFVATDVKGEYTALAAALGVPVLELRPGGDVRVNPLERPDGRLEFASALAGVLVDRSLESAERAALSAAVRLLPEAPQVRDLYGILREMPAALCDELAMSRDDALHQTRDLRFGFGELLAGVHAGMFDGASNIDPAASKAGFVVDVSGVGRDDRALRLAMLAGTRATDQLIASVPGRTLNVNDEAWRLAGTLETVRYLQHSFKLGRQVALGNVIVVHRLAELGGQADGATGQIASRLVSDADTQILFRQGDDGDARDAVARLGLPDSTVDVLTRLPPYRCLIRVRDRMALVQVVLSPRLRSISDTNQAMRGESRASSTVS